MLLQIDRRPPPIEDVVRRMKVRIDRDGLRANAETIFPTHAACSTSGERSERSRRHCHLPAERSRPRYPSPRDTGEYVPEMSARIDNDRNLTDGARRCARKIMAYVYRKNRDGRDAEITVSYLVKALGRCSRSVQRYLRQLEAGGYISVEVIYARTRMCSGLLVEVLAPLFPRHRRQKWPQKLTNSDTTGESQNNRLRYKYSRESWALRCMDGVFRAYMKTLPPPPPFPITV